jgi:hydroxymethylpyrimidine/phosphomethylpyrimidine kinase
MTPPVVLTIAGSDSGGGAGIQADLKTIAALRAFGTTAITAVTAQSTAEVRAVLPLPVELVRAQIDAVLDDLPVVAVKTGMLATAAIAELVVELAEAGRLPNLVVDPVMVSSTGTRLLDPDAERLYRDRLLPAASVFTPNRLEAGVLLGRDLRTLADQQAAALELAARTRGIVVVKGGHAAVGAGTRSVDVIACAGVLDAADQPRIDTRNNHGSGCSFASAIAASLAHGQHPRDAVQTANEYVHRAIRGAARWNLGSGHGPLDHFHWEQA